MRRHSIIARLGPADTEKIKVTDKASHQTEIRFVSGKSRLEFGLGQIMDGLRARGLCPSEDAVDLALLAGAITAADTRIDRASESQDSWTREMDLYVPVLDVPRWRGTTALIERMLAFLTGDRWRVYFRARPAAYKALSDQDLDVNTTFSSICMFSGGLDSFTGAIDLLEDGEEPLFVSHYWDASTSSQLRCARSLGKKYGNLNPRHVRAHVGFREDLVDGSGSEKTLRGRSFLFFALAALGASALPGETTIYVPENGFISLNVALDPLRLGAWSTRTTHPFYMARWNELLIALGISAQLRNPFRFMTKGEMLTACRNLDLLRAHAAETISCSSYTKSRFKGLPLGHCGYCVPCLIRRAAMTKAFGKDETEYRIVTKLRGTLDGGKAEGTDIRSFQTMIARVAKNPALARTLIHKPGPLGDCSADEIDKYAGVFARGLDEVGAIVDKVKVKAA